MKKSEITIALLMLSIAGFFVVKKGYENYKEHGSPVSSYWNK